MLVKFLYNQPILDIDSEGFGLNRNRNPDTDWAELVKTKLDNYTNNIKDIDISLTMNLEYKLILLEDLAYTYGKDSMKFRNKLIEFNLI